VLGNAKLKKIKLEYDIMIFRGVRTLYLIGFLLQFYGELFPLTYFSILTYTRWNFQKRYEHYGLHFSIFA